MLLGVTLIEFCSVFMSVETNPRVVQLMSPPYKGSIVLTAGSAQFGADLTNKEGVSTALLKPFSLGLFPFISWKHFIINNSENFSYFMTISEVNFADIALSNH